MIAISGSAQPIPDAPASRRSGKSLSSGDDDPSSSGGPSWPNLDRPKAGLLVRAEPEVPRRLALRARLAGDPLRGCDRERFTRAGCADGPVGSLMNRERRPGWGWGRGEAVADGRPAAGALAGSTFGAAGGPVVGGWTGFVGAGAGGSTGMPGSAGSADSLEAGPGTVAGALRSTAIASPGLNPAVKAIANAAIQRVLPSMVTSNVDARPNLRFCQFLRKLSRNRRSCDRRHRCGRGWAVASRGRELNGGRVSGQRRGPVYGPVRVAA
jgi:hypothetical protein